MRNFELQKDSYDLGYGLFKKQIITLNPGVTVLVGCNGIGKSTLLYNIEKTLSKNDIPYIHYDNLNDGGFNARSKAIFSKNYDFLVQSCMSSEGENIMLNIGQLARDIGRFVSRHNESKELWILMDSCDSGLSIDNIEELKKCLLLMSRTPVTLFKG